MRTEPARSPRPFFEAPGGSPAARRLLLISPRFPPAFDVGALRWQKMARYVAERGWEMDVIAFPPECIPLPDRTTLEDLPPGTRIFGVPTPVVPVARLIDAAWKVLRKLRPRAAMPARGGTSASTSPGVQRRPDSLVLSEIRWSLTNPRSYVRAYNTWVASAELKQWARQASRLARHIVSPHVHDVIISSGPPQAAHEAARLASRESGIPFVMDMRDAWSLVQRCQEPIASPLLLRLARRQERRVVNEAALVIANTEMVRSAMIESYPEATERILTVTNGFDDDPLPRTQHGRQFVVAYAGTIYMGRDPGCLFQAARRVIEELNLSPSQFALKFMGGNDRGVSLQAMADAAGVGDFLHADGPRPRARALEFLAQATMLVILPQDWDMSIPAKLFEYVRFEAWLLALTDRNTATALALRGTDADVVSPSDVSAIAAVLRARYEQHVAGTRPSRISRDVRLSRRSQAQVLLDALERLVQPSARQRMSLAVH